ncbi:TIGR02710 family CRISPR-associated CARF protein [Acidiphilium sp.]|uniref:TIGR02710 family CRISPR-associated CARF protein n=1 Tax=Acidiphilium sp. TaxID=527 RepID=UPI002589A951|nr:TIGR02710 family CRISPR-associated CARF protein [Acidiphilium sp.]
MPQTALLLTVGTGNQKDPEATLYTPLLKSARDGKFSLIVLLPSQQTHPYAEELKNRLAGKTVEIHPLPGAWEENAVDSCYRHFDDVIGKLRGRGFSPVHLTADFTRGTKAMSAALTLAAVRHGLAMTRYIEGERDDRGMVIAGSEKIRGFAPEEALFARRLDEARALFLGGSFAAVETLMGREALPDVSGDIRARADAVRSLAAFCLAWDRLDYTAAALNKLPVQDSLPPDWRTFFPPKEVQNWLSLLAENACRDDKKAMAARCQRLIADLLGNARRRLAQGQYEDCLIRAYRILELLGQSRLFALDYDSQTMPDDERMKQFLATLNEGEARPQKRRQGYSFGREHVARFLKSSFPRDGFGEKLLAFAGNQGRCVVQRNHSILAHGFDAVSAGSRENLEVALTALEGLFRDLAGNETTKSYLTCSCWLDFSHPQAE